MKGDLTLCPWTLSLHCCKHCVAKLLLSLYCFSIASASLSAKHQNNDAASPAALYAPRSAQKQLHPGCREALRLYRVEGKQESPSAPCTLPCPLFHHLVFPVTAQAVKVTQQRDARASKSEGDKGT